MPGPRGAVCLADTRFRNGRCLTDALRPERVIEDELRAAVRLAGHADPATARSVIIESDSGTSVTGGGAVRRRRLRQRRLAHRILNEAALAEPGAAA